MVHPSAAFVIIGTFLRSPCEINFRFQPEVCDGCHDLLWKAISFNGVAIVSIKGNDYRTHFWYE